MANNEYLGEIGNDDLKELFLYRNAVRSLGDIIRTLKDPNDVVECMLDGISEDEITSEIEYQQKKKDEKFREIYKKYPWLKVTELNNITITDEGKAYTSRCSNIKCKFD